MKRLTMYLIALLFLACVPDLENAEYPEIRGVLVEDLELKQLTEKAVQRWHNYLQVRFFDVYRVDSPDVDIVVDWSDLPDGYQLEVQEGIILIDDAIETSPCGVPPEEVIETLIFDALGVQLCY